jgi:hypothetical protein
MLLEAPFAMPVAQAGPRAPAVAPAPANHVPDTPERPPRALRA